MENDFEDLSPIANTKRSRASNFTSQEEDILMSLVERHANVIENKRTNAVTWQEKKSAWDEIAKQFGAQSQSVRSAKHLRDKYDNMKRKAKTALSVNKNQLYKTGGGPFCSNITNNDERIASLLGKSATGLSNNIDSDTPKVQHDDIIEIDFLEDEFDINETSKTAEQIDDKTNLWSKWKLSTLKKPKSEKLNFKNSASHNKNDHLLEQQATFFENEDKRAEERHKLQIKELQLKEELLKLEIEYKKMEIRRIEDKEMYLD